MVMNPYLDLFANLMRVRLLIFQYKQCIFQLSECLLYIIHYQEKLIAFCGQRHSNNSVFAMEMEKHFLKHFEMAFPKPFKICFQAFFNGEKTRTFNGCKAWLV